MKPDSKLIIMRGNSGSGKSTIARAVQQQARTPVAVIEQDYYRHQLLSPWDKQAFVVREILLRQTTKTLLDQGYSVIIEGVLPARWFGDTYRNIIQSWSGESLVYYFDISLNETLRRHALRLKSHISQEEIRQWYKEKDFLKVANERIIPESLSEQQVVRFITASASL